MRAVWSTAVPADTRALYFISTRRHDMFGLHQLRHDDTYASHVITFADKRHAESIAKGLQKVYDQTGAFPPRDTDIESMSLPSDVDGVKLEDVTVHSSSAGQLADRLAGTRIFLTMVSCGDDETLQFHDLTPDHTPLSTCQSLRGCWDLTPGGGPQNAVVSFNLKMDTRVLLPLPPRRPLLGKVSLRTEGILTMFMAYVLAAEFAMAAALMKAFL